MSCCSLLFDIYYIILLDVDSLQKATLLIYESFKPTFLLMKSTPPQKKNNQRNKEKQTVTSRMYLS